MRDGSEGFGDPEQQLEPTLRQLASIDYVTADLVERSVKVKPDTMTLPFPNDSFDLIISNDVLEHVFDDRAGSAGSFQDPTASTEAERTRMFGQPTSQALRYG